MKKDFVSKEDENFKKLYNFIRGEFANNEVIDELTILHRWNCRTKDRLNGEWHTHYGRVIDTLLADGIIRRCSIPSNTITYIVQKPKNTQENDKAKENSR